MSFERPKYRSGPVQVTAREAATFTIPTPAGETEVTYGAYDRLTARYRGEDLMANDMARLRKDIDAAEAEYQSKKAEKTARAQAAKNPLPALRAGTLEEIVVRGIDQRNGDALIIDSHGEKTSVSPSKVLNRLDAPDRVDLANLYKATDAAAQTMKDAAAPRIREVLEARGVEIDLAVRIDLDTMERVTEHDGVEYRAADDRALISLVLAALVADERPLTMNRSDDALVPTAGRTDLTSYTSVYRTQDEYEREVAAEEAYKAAKEAQAKAEAEVQFDLSLFSAVVDKPAAEDEDVHIDPNLRAPEGGEEW